MKRSYFIAIVAGHTKWTRARFTRYTCWNKMRRAKCLNRSIFYVRVEKKTCESFFSRCTSPISGRDCIFQRSKTERIDYSFNCTMRCPVSEIFSHDFHSCFNDYSHSPKYTVNLTRPAISYVNNENKWFADRENKTEDEMKKNRLVLFKVRSMYKGRRMFSLNYTLHVFFLLLISSKQ